MGVRTCLSIILLVFAVPVVPVKAVDFLTPDSFIHSPDQIQSNELWVAAGEIRVEGRVLDDCFLFGSNLVLSARFEDDLWAAGTTVHFSGKATDRARLAAAQLLQISGILSEGLFAAARTLQIRTNAVLGADSFLSGENVIFEGRSVGKLHAAASKISIKGVIENDVSLAAEDIVLMPGTQIHGNLTYTSGKELVPGKAVTIEGDLIRIPIEKSIFASAMGISKFLGRLHWVFFANAGLIGCLYILLSSRRVGLSVRACRSYPLRCLFTGLILFLVLPGLVQLLLLSRFGIPTAVFLGALYGLGLYIGKIVVALLVGGMILRLQGRQRIPRVLLSFIVGLALLYFVMAIPMIGIIVWSVVGSFGLGGWALAHVESQMQAAQNAVAREEEISDELNNN